MVVKTLFKLGVASAATAGAIHLIRKHDLVTKAGVLANTAVEKAAAGAEAFIAKGIGLTSEVLTRFADDPTSEDEAADEKPAPRTKMGYGDVTGDGGPLYPSTLNPWQAATRNGETPR